MKDTDFDTQSIRARDLITKWSGLLVSSWHIDVDTYDYDAERTDSDRNDRWRPAFEVVTRWEHLQARISVYCPQLVDYTDAQLAESIIHELIHVILNELRHTTDDWLQHEERVATQLARAIQRIAS